MSFVVCLWSVVVMLEILRNMARRKMRTGLTVFGIVIGIFALTVMGSMSEYFNGIVDNAVKSAGTNIGVSPKGGDFTSVLTENDRKRIERVPGVRYVIPYVYDLLQEIGGVSLGSVDMIYGQPPELLHEFMPYTQLQRGRWLQRGDEYQAVIGSKIESKRNLDLGGKIVYREREFTVVGLLAETQTSPDTSVFVPLEAVRRLLKSPDLMMVMDVVPENPAEADALADRIRAAVDDVNVTTPQVAIEQARQSIAIFDVILLSGAVLAVVVGGLAVVNTMIMSVSERTPEIGLKKAIGASDLDIVKEYVTEAALMGLIGGVIGFLLGSGLANLLNATVAQALGGTNIFTVTPRLAVLALSFALLLGTGAGLVPAWSAARLDPMRALRAK
ncbi:MAG: ABC transporter permease [Rudaea sp.]